MESVNAATLFPKKGDELENHLRSAFDFQTQAKQLEKFFLKLVPDVVPQNLQWISRAVDLIVANNVSTIQQLLGSLRVGESKCQRTFKEWVGVSPKFFIRTRRFQFALKQILNGGQISWAELAIDLGYYDQSHFINDFKTITGQIPSFLANQQFAGFLQDSRVNP